MKAPNLKKWKLTTNVQGLLFFAQLVNELLFDYAPDTYKLPALNSRLLALEVKHSIHHYEGNILKRGSLQPIVDELRDRLGKDPVIRTVMTEYYVDYLSMLKENVSVAELRIRIDFLYNKIENSYLSTCIELLRAAVLEGKEKEKIIRLTRVFLTELIDKGYSSRYIFFESDRFFFSGPYPAKIDSPDIIDTYFKQFTLRNVDYLAIYRASRNIRSVRDYAPNLSLEILEKPPDLEFRGRSQAVDSFFKDDDRLPLFVIVKELKACDRDKAREQSDHRLFLLDSLAKYYVHRINLRIGEGALIYSVDQNEFGIVKKPRPPVMKRPDLPVEKLSKLLEKMFTTIISEKLDEESTLRLSRAFLGHNTGIKAEAPESQLLAFWSAVEVLFPPSGAETDRVVQIIDSMIPFVCSEYAAKLASDLYRSLKLSGSKDAVELLNKIPEGVNPIEKCLALFSIGANEPIRQELYSLFPWHPLMRTRVFHLCKRFSSADVVTKTLEGHIQRVGWQIRRIYRARNLIIHSGKSLPYINILVENLHSYLDRVLDVFMEEISRSRHSLTLDQIALEIKLEMESHLRNLKRLGKIECSPDNYKNVLFGN